MARKCKADRGGGGDPTCPPCALHLSLSVFRTREILLTFSCNSEKRHDSLPPSLQLHRKPILHQDLTISRRNEIANGGRHQPSAEAHFELRTPVRRHAVFQTRLSNAIQIARPHLRTSHLRTSSLHSKHGKSRIRASRSICDLH
ncbi:unnamed protein product [Ectocarpus sp. 12 AP-2014]